MSGHRTTPCSHLSFELDAFCALQQQRQHRSADVRRWRVGPTDLARLDVGFGEADDLLAVGILFVRAR